MPGIKPYYRLAVDGQFIAAPKKIPSGCTEIREEFLPKFSKGGISLFVYVSEDGKTDDPKPQSIQFNKGEKTITMVIPNISLPQMSRELSDYKALFDEYSYGYVKVSKPKILEIQAKTEMQKKLESFFWRN